SHITPVDVLATAAVNSFVNSAPQVRAVHRAMAAACDPLLAEVPSDADLLDENAVNAIARLVHAAVQARFVLIPVATKVLHRKRPALIPMLDQVLLDYYADALGCSEL